MKLKKVKNYRFWKIRPIIVDKKLNFFKIKFNHLSEEYIDLYRKTLYLPSYYPRDNMSYTFKFFQYNRLENYINLHLKRIETFFTKKFDELYKNYTTNLRKKYNLKKDKVLKYIKNEYSSIYFNDLYFKKPKISKVAIRNIDKKVVKSYISEMSCLI